MSLWLPTTFFSNDIYQFYLQAENWAWPRKRTPLGKRETSKASSGCVGQLCQFRNEGSQTHDWCAKWNICRGLSKAGSWGQGLKTFQLQREIYWSFEVIPNQNLLESPVFFSRCLPDFYSVWYRTLENRAMTLECISGSPNSSGLRKQRLTRLFMKSPENPQSWHP